MSAHTRRIKPHLHVRPFDLWPDFFCLDMFSWGAPAGPSGQRRHHQRRRRLSGALLLEKVYAEAQTPIGRQIPVTQLRHAPGELLHAAVQVSEDGEVHFSLQAGCRADRDAGTLSFNAQVGFLQVQDLLVLVILRNGAKTFLPWFPLQKRTVDTDYLTLKFSSRSRILGFCLIIREEPVIVSYMLFLY